MRRAIVAVLTLLLMSSCSAPEQETVHDPQRSCGYTWYLDWPALCWDQASMAWCGTHCQPRRLPAYTYIECTGLFDMVILNPDFQAQCRYDVYVAEVDTDERFRTRLAAYGLAPSGHPHVDPLGDDPDPRRLTGSFQVNRAIRLTIKETQ